MKKVNAFICKNAKEINRVIESLNFAAIGHKSVGCDGYTLIYANYSWKWGEGMRGDVQQANAFVCETFGELRDVRESLEMVGVEYTKVDDEANECWVVYVKREDYLWK